MVTLDQVARMARVAGDGLLKRAMRVAQRGRFETDLLQELPARFRPAARFAFGADWTAQERALAKEIESFRERIPSLVSGDTLSSLPSPRVGEFTLDDKGHSHGAALKHAPAAKHAKTGVGPGGGTLLYRIASGMGAKRILELGTNTGFSGCYLVSSPSQPELVTVEGSADLCAVARKNIGRFSQKVTVMNMLFDEAIDALVAQGQRFDCAFIDGQHERNATLHYAARLEPLLEKNAVIVFDDIYWSDDMNQAWKTLCMSPKYCLTLDLAWKGLAVLGDDEPKRHFDVCDYIGRTRVRKRPK
jgi:predicted O-methyltransferase YrrM